MAINGVAVNGKMKPSPHAETHKKGGADEVELDASQIVSGVLAEDRIPHELTNAISIPSIKDTSGEVRVDFSDGSYTNISPRLSTKYGNGYVKGGTGVDTYFYVGSLPYDSTSTYQKLFILVWGGSWDWKGSGLEILVVSSRGGKKVFRSRLLGETSHYELKIYDNGGGYDVYVHTVGDWPNFLVRAFKMEATYWEGAGFEEVKVIPKTPSGTDDTANWELVDTILTYNDKRVKVGGSIQVDGNSILDSGGNVRISFGSLTKILPSLHVDGDAYLGANPSYIGTSIGGTQYKVLAVDGSGLDNVSALSVGSSVSVYKLYYSSMYQSSSIELKEDIEDYPLDALSALLGLRLRKFRWKQSGAEDIGFIAEEVQEVAPELVDTSGGRPAIRVNRMLFYAVRAIQQLAERLNDVEESIKELKEKVSVIEARLDALAGSS